MLTLLRPHRFLPPGPFSPDGLGGLAQWYDPSDAATLTMDGSNVAQMDDKSGNGDHATQATALARPLLGSINGVQALAFSTSGTDDYMMLPDPSGIAGSQNRSLFVVAHATSLSNDRTIITYGAAQQAQAFDLEARSNGVLRFSIWGLFYDTVMPLDTSPHILGVVLDGTTLGDCTVYIDGAGEQATGNNTINTAAAGTPRLGTLHDIEVAGMQGLIGDILLYDRAFSSAERQKVEGWLAHKWGLEARLPSDHPYKSESP